jgi:hypothetical protein
MTEPRPEQETDPEASREGPGGTPEGHTPERPASDEYGKPGTPAAGLTPETPHAADADDARAAEEDAHAADAHHVGGGHDHAHATGHAHDDGQEADHGEAPAGPIDWGAWLVSIVGLAAGGVVALVIGQVLAQG